MAEILGPPPSHLTRHPRLGEWIEVVDGRVAIKSGKVELGQGIGSAMATIAAEEMWIAPDSLTVVPTSTDRSPNEDYTSGSFSVSQGGVSMRAAAAAARSILLEAAEARFGADHGVAIVEGEVRVGGAAIGYPDVLTPEALGRTITEVPVRGTAGPARAATRIDMPAKLAGAPAYIQDIELPGMLHGRPVRPPGAPRRLLRFDDARAATTPDLVRIVRDGDFVGVVATREASAVRAAELLAADCAWEAPTTLPDGDWLERAASAPDVAFERGALASDNTRRTVAATYSKPYIAHASVGPSCGLARTDDQGRLEVWSHSQGVFPLRQELAALLERPAETIIVHHAEGAGCYGHNGAEDAAMDAIVLSSHVDGRPVRVQWSRADEFGNEPYGPAMQIRLEASLDEQGHVETWAHQVWSNGHTARPGRGAGLSLIAAAEQKGVYQLVAPMDPPLPYGGALRNAVPLYAFPNVQVTRHLVEEIPVRVSALRSLGAYANVFAIESFVDELAAAAGADPLDFRLSQLQDPRAKAVLNTLADHVGWRSREADGRSLGLAFAQYKNAGAFCAAVAELDESAALGVGRLTLAVEAGRIVNPDGAENQVSGGAIQAASWTLKEGVPFGGAGRPQAWGDYPVMRFSEAPRVEVLLLDRPDLPSVGVGECAQGPVAAAIANAFSAGFGVRVRDLPITRERVLSAL